MWKTPPTVGVVGSGFALNILGNKEALGLLRTAIGKTIFCQTLYSDQVIMAAFQFFGFGK